MELESVKPKKTDLLRKVPELSLNHYVSGTLDQKQRFIESFYNGLVDYGFVVLKDHPIDEALLQKAYDQLEKLFALPEAIKKSYISPAGGGKRGYTAFGQEHAKGRTIADLKEFWHVGRELVAGDRYFDIYPPNVWPTELVEFKATFQKIYNELDRVGHIMLEALTIPLRLKNNFFFEMTQDGDSILRLLHYPPVPAELAASGAVRAAAHEDINLITILVSATASGLELKDRDQRWLPIESSPNSLIVDAGDMLARLTNDVIPSTTHRVVNPVGENGHRYSIPFFIHPHPKANLSCLESCRGTGAKYPDILAGEFLLQRLREIGLIK